MFPDSKVQIDYIEKIVKLQLRYCHYLFKKKKIVFNNAINNYCDIYRKTDLYSVHPGMQYKQNCFFPGKKVVWNKLVNQMSNLIKEENISDPNKFINKSYDLLLPRLLARIDKKFNLVEYNKKARFGCFDYDTVNKKINLHMPVFQFRAEEFTQLRIKEKKSLDKYKFLLDLVKHALKMYPNYKIIQCGIWMNTYTPFKKLFPSSWQPTGILKKENSLACWGQFADVNGGINQQIADKFVEKFIFPYSAEFYECNISDLKDYLIFQ